MAQVYPADAFWRAITGLNSVSHRHTLEVLHICLSVTVGVIMRFKQSFSVERPAALSPALQPMIQSPGYGAYPSGHATEGHLTARLLQLLMGEAEDGATDLSLQALAKRIAINREVAGLHFSADSVAGRVLGDTLARHFAACAKSNCSWKSSEIIADDVFGRDNSGPGDATLSQPFADFNVRAAKPVKAGQASYFALLWERAEREWK